MERNRLFLILSFILLALAIVGAAVVLVAAPDRFKMYCEFAGGVAVVLLFAKAFGFF